MKKFMALAVVAGLSLNLVGCDAQTRNAPGNTTLGSAAVGGLAGAGIGAIADSNNRGRGALIGAGVGTLGGAALGSMAENNRNQQQINQMQQQNAYQAGYTDANRGPAPRSY